MVRNYTEENKRRNIRRATNRDKARMQDRKDYQKNRDKRLAYKKKYIQNNKLQIQARNIVDRYWRKNGIKFTECSQCKSKENLVRHHADYTKPLEVIILCKLCHNRLHKLSTHRQQDTSRGVHEGLGDVPMSDTLGDGGVAANTHSSRANHGRKEVTNTSPVNTLRGRINQPMHKDNPDYAKGCGKKELDRLGNILRICGVAEVADFDEEWKIWWCPECREKSK